MPGLDPAVGRADFLVLDVTNVAPCNLVVRSARPHVEPVGVRLRKLADALVGGIPEPPAGSTWGTAPQAWPGGFEAVSVMPPDSRTPPAR